MTNAPETAIDSTIYDAVVVGAGIAGLTAAWRLRDRNVLVLECQDRVGGRMKSHWRGDYWISVGPHLFPGPDSVVGRTIDELGLKALPIGGAMRALSYRGRVYEKTRPELLPLVLPLAARARLSMMRAGAKIVLDAQRFSRLARPHEGEDAMASTLRQLSFLNDRTFNEYIGRLHPQVEEIFHALVNRGGAEPDQVAAGSVISFVAQLWGGGSVQLGRNLVGGASALTDALATALAPRVRLGHRVTSVVRDGDDYRLLVATQEREFQIRSHGVIVATPPNATLPIISDTSPGLAQVLRQLAHGPLVAAGILTSETRPMPWDDIYSMLVVGRSFNMFFNHANVLRRAGEPRRPGGALMISAAAGPAAELLSKSDAQIEAIFTRDLFEVFPEAKGKLREIVIQKWEYGAPYAKPGRAQLQAPLQQGDGRLLLAGDYVGAWVSMESAAQTGQAAAQRLDQLLGSSSHD